MTDWIEIPPDALIASHETANDMELFRSPFDVPSALRVSYHGPTQVVRIEFRYIGDNESKRRLDITERVWFEVGRRSHRLFVINVSVHGLSPTDLTGVLQEAGARMPRRLKALASENYDATAEAIAQNQPAIQQRLAAVTG